MASNMLSLNQDKIDKLKLEMNYEKIIRQLPKESAVILDWRRALTSFKDNNDVTWSGDIGTYGGNSGHGRLKVHLTSNNESINVIIHSMSQGQKDAIDIAIWEATNSNAPFIYYKYDEQCFSNFCLIPRKGNIIESMLFVYGNILIELEHSDNNQDVLPVAHYLQSVMEKAVAANPEQKLPPRPKFSYSVQPNQPRAGGTFTVTVTPGYQKESWRFDVAEDLLSDNVDYEEDLGDNIYKFTAKAAGKGKVVFSLMDKKTLWVFTDTVVININPVK